MSRLNDLMMLKLKQHHFISLLENIKLFQGKQTDFQMTILNSISNYVNYKKKIVSKCFLNFLIQSYDYLPGSNLITEHSPVHNFVTTMTQHLQLKSVRCISYHNYGKY